MNKEIKKRTKENDFYLSTINELKKTTNITKICEKLNLSKQNLDYYLRELKSRGYIIRKGRGWYELTEKGKKLTKYSNILPKDISRGHAYVWKVKLPKKIKNWDKRIEILKQKKIDYKLVGALKTTPRIKVLNRKVWLCNNHLRIFDKKNQSYYGKTAIESKNLAFQELLNIIRALENKLGFLFRPFNYSFQKEHYALIKNDLANEYNRKGEILRIKDETGEWLLVDDSLGNGGELENMGKKAFQTNISMQRWWNDHKKHNFEITPSFQLKMMNGIQQNQLMFAKNIESHIQAIKTIGKGIIKQNNIFEEMRDLFKRSHKDSKNVKTQNF